MSKYTTQLRFICEEKSCLDSSVDFSNIDLVIQSAYYKIFDFDFPIFDERYRKPLCCKILRHNYFKEIGFETYALWKANLCITLNDIMPYYNKLYRSELLEFNPFYDVDLKRTHNIENVGNTNTKNNSNSTTNNTERYSETPQGSITDLKNDKYLTSATITDNTGKIDQTTNSDINTTEDYIEKVIGKQNGKSYSQLLKEYRDTFINIDMDVLEELNCLFMLLW